VDSSSLNQTVDNINQANNTNEWVLFTFVVIVPIAFILISAIVVIPLSIARQRKFKCPRCGNWRYNKSALQTVRTVEGNKTIVKKERIITCKKCKNEYSI
jgi:predicted nucleic-acid-binding Zn-ribbon protein